MLNKLIASSTAIIASILTFHVASAPVAATPVGEGHGCAKVDLETGQCLFYLSKPEKDKKETGGAQQTGSRHCEYQGQVVPCKTGNGTLDPSTGCYLTLDNEAGNGDQVYQGKKVWAYTCWRITSVVDGKPVGLIDPRIVFKLEPIGEPTITPAEAAAQVAALIKYTAPDLGISQKTVGPNGRGYVGVPVWLWVKNPGPTTTGPTQHLRRTVAGLTVDVTARLISITWGMGDGTEFPCGVGTPWSESYGAVDSPTCGHRYSRVSAEKPGGKYTITATSTWVVDWTAGGQSGTINPPTVSASDTLRVGEIQAVVVPD